MTHCCLSGIYIWRILFMTHCYIWRIADFMANIYHAYWIFVQYIHNMWVFLLSFLCKMLYMCSVFYMIFVQFLGVIKCLNNPYFTICRIAHTKKPHRANFGAFDLFVTTQILKPLQGSTRPYNPTHLMCTLNRCTRFRPSQGKNPFSNH